MGYNYNHDTDTVTPFGDGGHVGENEGMFGRFVLVPKGDSISTETLAKTLSSWTTPIERTSGRWYVTPPIRRIEALKETAEVFAWNDGSKRTISFGKYGYRVAFDIADATMAAMFSSNYKEYDAYIITKNGYIKGRKDSTGTVFYPKRVDEWLVEGNMQESDGKVKYVSAVINFGENDDFEKDSIFVIPTAFDPMTLTGVRQVDVTATDGAVTKHADVTVKDKAGFGIEGLVAADFTASGLTIDGAITDNGDGDYDITFTATGTLTDLTLVASASISVDDHIEVDSSSGEVTIT